jgi:hypothetical protein
MEQVTLTRKELYDLVWAQPLSRLTKKYKISDNGLRKICKRMNIPILAIVEYTSMTENRLNYPTDNFLQFAALTC